MRRILTLGLVIATAVGAVGCNSGSKTGTRKSAAAATSADAPQIAGISPANGPVDGGTAVIISGSNFTKAGAGQTLVLFGTRGVVVTPTSDTEINVTAPLQTNAGVVDVRVINDLGIGTSAGAYTYDPRTTGLTFFPLVGTANPVGQGGTKITLDLVSFVPLTAGATVDFGAVPATVVVVDQDTLIAEVPAGLVAGTSSITVTEGAATISAQGFRVQGTLNPGDLVFNEVLLDPASTDANNDGVGTLVPDEFVELVNTTADPIDLTYILLRDNAATTNTVNHQFPNPTTIPPGGSIVVFGGGMPEGFAERHASGSAQQSISAGGTLGLNNSGETLVIEDQHGVLAGTIVFKVTLPQQDQAVPGTSWTLRNEGQSVATPTASTIADYEKHPPRVVTPTTTFNHSAGTKRDGSSF